jgi:hypothetical protein
VEIRSFTAEQYCCKKPYVSSWAKLYKKNHFSEIRFPLGLLFEDVFVTHRLIFMQKQVISVEIPLYYYFMREGSITHSQWNPRNLAQVDGLKKQLEFYKKNGYKDAHRVVAKDYMTVLKKHIDSVKQIRHIYLKEYLKLKYIYKISLLKYHKYFPIKSNTNMYRQAFPYFTKFYKKLTYLKGEKRNETRKIFIYRFSNVFNYHRICILRFQ